MQQQARDEVAAEQAKREAEEAASAGAEFTAAKGKKTCRQQYLYHMPLG
jgi:hypothetical protein